MDFDGRRIRIGFDQDADPGGPGCSGVEGITILVVEQNAHRALELATRGYVIEMGTIVMAGDAEQLRRDPGVQRAYLGADPDELLAGVPGSG